MEENKIDNVVESTEFFIYVSFSFLKFKKKNTQNENVEDSNS